MKSKLSLSAFHSRLKLPPLNRVAQTSPLQIVTKDHRKVTLKVCFFWVGKLVTFAKLRKKGTFLSFVDISLNGSLYSSFLSVHLCSLVSLSSLSNLKFRVFSHFSLSFLSSSQAQDCSSWFVEFLLFDPSVLRGNWSRENIS